MRLSSPPRECKAHFTGLLITLLVLCGGRALALAPGVELGQFSRQVWQTENGLPQNTVHCVIQTRDGYVWAATEEGLARFDGLGFVVFDKENTPQLKTNDVRSVMQDRAGALWLSTSEGLVRLSGDEADAFTTEQGLPSNDVELTYETRAGDICVGTAAGLARFSAGAFTNFNARGGLAAGGVQALLEDGEGALWVGTTEGLSRLKGGE